MLSPHEVWEDVDYLNSKTIYKYDSSYTFTRQLDYYLARGVTIDNYSLATKKYLGINSNWWLRSARTINTADFYCVLSDGLHSHPDSIDLNGVSPAFRIG